MLVALDIAGMRFIIILFTVDRPLKLKFDSPLCCAKEADEAEKPDGDVQGVLGSGDSSQNSNTMEPIVAGWGKPKPKV